MGDAGKLIFHRHLPWLNPVSRSHMESLAKEVAIFLRLIAPNTA
jgi:hypothetical protein